MLELPFFMILTDPSHGTQEAEPRPQGVGAESPPAVAGSKLKAQRIKKHLLETVARIKLLPIKF